MLVLGFEPSEDATIEIPGELLLSGQPLQMRVEVCSIRGRYVRLGFDGPRAIGVTRKRKPIEGKVPT